MIVWKNKFFWLGIGSLFFSILWIFGVAPKLTSLPIDFKYEAEVLSLDNFYDEAQQKFTGEKRSLTKFSYETVKNQDNVLSIKNIFDVRTITGDKIFSVERLYGIDAQTGQHVHGFGDRDRGGYLFAPRRLKPGKPFTYWHINYDGPAEMRYLAQEEVYGLPTYHYESDYEGVEIDQTNNLGDLPEVQETRGVRLKPHLELWIEPVSGFLVKYRDETTAYYYDLKTKTDLFPWNKFSNNYTRSSIIENVSRVKSLRLKIILFDRIIPSFLIILIVVCLGLGRHRKLAIKLGLLGTVVLGGITLLFILTPQANQIFTIGIAQWGSHPEYTRNVNGFKEALAYSGYVEGKDVKFIITYATLQPEQQRENIESLLAQKVDLIYSLTTPGTIIAKEIASTTPIVFSVVTYPVETKLIASLFSSQNNLVGSRNWVPLEEQLKVFLELVPNTKSIGFVRSVSEPQSLFQLQEMRDVAGAKNIKVVDLLSSDLANMEYLLLEHKDEMDALYSSCDTLIQNGGEDVIATFTETYKVPDFTCLRSGVMKGSLIGVIADFNKIGKLAGEKAALILEGATPTSLETTTDTEPLIILNRTRATALGLDIPQSLLIRSVDTIE